MLSSRLRRDARAVFLIFSVSVWRNARKFTIFAVADSVANDYRFGNSGGQYILTRRFLYYAGYSLVIIHPDLFHLVGIIFADFSQPVSHLSLNCAV